MRSPEAALLPLLQLLSDRAEPLRGLIVDDPALLVHEAANHGLSGVVARALEEAELGLPPPHAEELRRNRLGSIARSLRVKTLLLRTLEALAEVKVVPVLLKGPALSARLYGDAVIRETTDVDLLLANADVSKAIETVERMGMSLDDHAENYYPPPFRHHLSYANRTGLVELHFRAMSAFGVLVEAEEWIHRSREWAFEGRPARLLLPEDELVYLALHGASHMFQRIAWLLDLKLFVRAHPDLDWARVISVARETALPYQVYFALDVARRLVGMPVPHHVLEALSPTVLRRVAGRWFYTGRKITRSALNSDKRTWVIAKFLMTDSRPRLVGFLGTRVLWEMRRRLGLGFPTTSATARK